PPVHKWNTTKEKGWKYRETIGVAQDCNMFYNISVNNERKRIDQLLLYFREHLLRKSCDKLVMHTQEFGGCDIVSVASRLGIKGNIRIIQDRSKQMMEGVMSAGGTYIGMPAAEGFGLPFWESALLGKKLIHSDVGEIGHI